MCIDSKKIVERLEADRNKMIPTLNSMALPVKDAQKLLRRLKWIKIELRFLKRWPFK